MNNFPTYPSGDLQVVYVISNPSMPGLLKIGMTKKSEVSMRMKELFTTGVPLPFELVFACKVPDAKAVEKALHVAFDPDRLHPGREFFEIEDPERVIGILKLLQVEEVTAEVEQVVEAQASSVDLNASKAYKKRRPKMNFEVMGIVKGETLVYKDDPLAVTATVVGPSTVEFQGTEMSLTAATRKVLGLPSNYALQPSPWWMYGGKSLKQIYDETHTVEITPGT